MYAGDEFYGEEITSPTERSFWTEEDLISTYTRQQAIEDGALIDVSADAKQLFKIPVAVTAAVWADISAIPPRFTGIQDTAGRLWDLLWTAQRAALMNRDQSSIIYRLIMHIGRHTYYTVKMVVGPGDAGEPVITFMRPEED